MKDKISAAVFLLLIHFSVQATSIILQGYNERCELYDETSTCDHSVGLMCIDSGLKGYRCKCPNDAQFGTIYDPKRNSCVGKVWNSCVRGGMHMHNPNLPPSHAKFNLNETLCVENAECNTKMYHLPICMCKKGFFELDEGLCIPSAKYGDPCDNDKLQCDSKYGVSCNPDNRCGCKDETHQFYDQEKCLTYVGGNCTHDDECVPMAMCGRGPGSVRGKRDIFFGSGETQKNAGVGYFGGPNFNNRPFPVGQFGGRNGQGKCICRSGYSPTNGFCMPSYWAECSPRSIEDKNNGNTTTEICNPDQFLECLGTGIGYEGKSGFRCQCRNPLNERWDMNLGKCVSLPGRRCRASPSYPKCEEGSECVRGVCECKNGTSLTPMGQCKLDFNEHCSPGECNILAGLTCHGKTKTCLCLDSYLNYNPQKKECVAEKGSPCGYVNFQQREAYNTVAPPFKKSDVVFINCENELICVPQGGRDITPDNTVMYTCVPKS